MLLQPRKPDPTASGNATGIVAMLVAMAAFVSNDTCVKFAGEHLPLGELIIIRNVLASAYVLAFAAVFGGLSWPRLPQKSLLAWRVVGEVMSTVFFLSGLIALPIADATAIGQFTPLAITAAAAIFLKEPAGLRKWLATLAGFLGVLLVVRPGTAAFQPAALLILAAVAMVVLRDLTTRLVNDDMPTVTLTLMSSASVILAGVMLAPFETWVVPTARDMAILALGAAFLATGLAFSIIAMRFGEVAVVSPFRYAVIFYALILGWVFWRQWPDPVQLLGISILVAAGVYVVSHARAALRAASAADRAASDAWQP